MSNEDPAIERFRNLADQVVGPDKAVLRYASYLMTTTGNTPTQLVALGAGAIALLIQNNLIFAPKNPPGNPLALAKRILLAMGRLRDRYPEAGLPVVADPSVRPPLPLMQLCKEPVRCVEERARWIAFRGKKGENDVRSISTQTSNIYIHFHRLYLSLCHDLGFVKDDQFSTVMMFDPAVYGPVIDEACQRLSPKHVASMSAGVLRIARDLYLEHPQHSENLTAFARIVARLASDRHFRDG